MRAIEIHESFANLRATGHEWLDPGKVAEQKPGCASTEDDPVKDQRVKPRPKRKPT